MFVRRAFRLTDSRTLAHALAPDVDGEVVGGTDAGGAIGVGGGTTFGVLAATAALICASL